MKRIAMISYHTCPLSSVEGKETGGMNVYVLELSKKLVELGYAVDVYTRDQDDSKEKIVQVTSNFRVIHLKAGPQTNIPKKNIEQFLPEFVNSFFSYTKKEHLTYDVIHCHYYLSGLAGLSLQKKLQKKTPLITTFHTLALMKNLVARTEDETESQERIDAEMKLIQNSQAIVSPSHADALYLEYLYQCPKEKIFIIPPGVNKGIYTPMDKTLAKKHIDVDKNTKLVLFVGRIEPLKGIDLLLYSIKIITQKHPKCPVNLLIIGGDTSQRKELWSYELQKLEELRSILHLTTAVTFLGRRKPEELPYYYNSADVAVMPSHYESFGMSALEAMSCGTPVITTDVAGISGLELTNEKHKNLLITTSNNPLLLAAKIHTFLTNEKLRHKISKQLVNTTEKFDWKYIAQKVNTLYQTLIYQ